MIINVQQTFKTKYNLFVDNTEVLNDVLVSLFLKKCLPMI